MENAILLNELSTLKDAHIVIIDGLIEIDRICKKNNIEYWIDSGTLLGAKRNGKFIAWDEDIDICMTRENYELFIKIAHNDLNKDKYFLQNYTTDKNYKIHPVPSKLRINNTFLLWTDQDGNEYNYNNTSHSGLYIDIFPMDKIPKHPFFGTIIKTLYKIYYQRRYNNKTIYKKTISLFGKIFLNYNMLSLLNRAYINYCKKTPYNKGYDYSCDMGLKAYNYPADIIFPLSSITFEGREYPCPNNVERYLTLTYGSDFMIPPKVIYQHGIIKYIHTKKY
ncbi:phosphorylcholine transferase LicD [Morganella morganii]|uniref:phosphorylcholine transferase LicD n=1 Tax=Morganella morganii TaxID=582 RepID=UPI0034D3F59E